MVNDEEFCNDNLGWVRWKEDLSMMSELINHSTTVYYRDEDQVPIVQADLSYPFSLSDCNL